MSRSGRRTDGLAPSLFPFLAVLLCTMGSLVLILMLSVAGAQHSVQQAAQELEEQFAWEETKLDLIASSLSQQLSEGRIELEKKRLVLQNLEQHIHELMEELAELQRQAARTDDAELTRRETTEQRQHRISELEKQLAEATQQIEQKLEQPQGDKPIFAIIPYDGPHGTHRRPIYLECNERGVVIQPEGIVVSPVDLKPPYGPGNPLDAALRTIRAEYPSATGSVTYNPYPLLVVRPSGIRHYMLARAAMNGWDDQFGYELISEDLELHFPPSPPHLKDKIAQTLELARQRQAALIMAMPQHYDAAQLQQFNLASGGDASRFADADSLAAGQRGTGDSAGGRGGFPDGPDMGYSDGATGSGSGGTGSVSLGGTSGSFDPVTATATDSARAATGTGLAAHGPAGGDFSQTGPTDAATPPYSGAMEGSVGGTTSAPGPAGGTGQSAASSMSGGQPSTAGAAGSAGQSAASSLSTSANSLSQPASGSTMDGESGSISPSLNLNFSNNSPEATRPVSQSRGENWAWRGAGRTQTAVVRAVRMECHQDCWVVLPDKGAKDPPITIELVGTPVERTEKLATVVRQRVDSWGVALAGGHWTPILHVDVASNADWRFDQLSRLLEGSGLEVVRREIIQPKDQRP